MDGVYFFSNRNNENTKSEINFIKTYFDRMIRIDCGDKEYDDAFAIVTCCEVI
jgi:hypothetical protein